MREIVDAIMPIIAFLVVCALFSIPAIWGMVVSTSLLGHLSQLLKKKKTVELDILVRLCGVKNCLKMLTYFMYAPLFRQFLPS